MIQELVTLSTLGIVRLLGALVLLSLGIALILWGLKRRRIGAVVMALFLCLAALVPAALAIEIPPAGSVAQIQTTGPNAGLNIGDWYTHNATTGSGYHFFEIFVPSNVPAGQVITVELFDPESLNITGFPVPDLDEPQGVEDNTSFTLTNPSGVEIATATYPPDASTDQQWVPFATFTRGADGYGIYRLTTTTSDDDENAWKLRVMPDNPDGEPGTGDEISVANMQTSFQHNGFGCQTFHFFIPDTDPVLLSNFDMDVPGFCDPLTCIVVYTTPMGVFSGSASGSTMWNNTTISLTHPPPGGDEFPDPGRGFPNPEPGWWQATLCLNDWNQYLFDTNGIPYFYEELATPDMIVSKDDGTETFVPGGLLTYTITYTNVGDGAALEAVLTDTLPDYTTFVSCTPRAGESCGEIPPPGSGIVTFSLGTVAAGTSGSVWLSVRVDSDAPPGSITDTVTLAYTDILFNDYPPETDTDVNQYEANPAIEIAKTPDSQTVVSGSTVTFSITVTNTGNVPLTNVTVTDPVAPDCARTFARLDPGESESYDCTVTDVTADFTNVATVTGTPPVGDDVTDSDPAEVYVIGPPTPTPTPTSEPSEPDGPSEPEPSPTPTPTATPSTPVTPTPTVEVLTVARLPETGGFPGWFTVVLGVPLIIGAAGLLLNLALLGMRGRRGDGKGD